MKLFKLMVIPVLFPALCHADNGAEVKHALTGPDGLKLRYEDRLLWAEIEGTELGEVAKALTNRTGWRVEVVNPAAAGEKVSARVAGLTVDAALKAILDGYSYISYPASNGGLPVVRIVSRGSQTESSRKAQPLTAKASAEPTVAEQRAAMEGTARLSAEKEAERAKAARLRDLETLRSAATGEARREALEGLVGDQDASATAALIEEANNRLTESPETRANAVDALWRHAADHEFADEAAISALRQLGEDEDPQVSAVARQALSDMERYLVAARAPEAAQSTDGGQQPYPESHQVVGFSGKVGEERP